MAFTSCYHQVHRKAPIMLLSQPLTMPLPLSALSMPLLTMNRQSPIPNPVVRAHQQRRLRHIRLRNDRNELSRLCDRLGHAPHESYLITVMLMSLVATVCGSQHYYSDSSYTLPPLSSQPRSTLRIARPRVPPTPRPNHILHSLRAPPHPIPRPHVRTTIITPTLPCTLHFCNCL